MAPTLTRLLHDTGFVRVVARVGQDSHSAAITHSSLSALTSSFLTHTQYSVWWPWSAIVFSEPQRTITEVKNIHDAQTGRTGKLNHVGLKITQPITQYRPV